MQTNFHKSIDIEFSRGKDEILRLPAGTWRIKSIRDDHMVRTFVYSNKIRVKLEGLPPLVAYWYIQKRSRNHGKRITLTDENASKIIEEYNNAFAPTPFFSGRVSSLISYNP